MRLQGWSPPAGGAAARRAQDTPIRVSEGRDRRKRVETACRGFQGPPAAFVWITRSGAFAEALKPRHPRSGLGLDARSQNGGGLRREAPFARITRRVAPASALAGMAAEGVKAGGERSRQPRSQLDQLDQLDQGSHGSGDHGQLVPQQPGLGSLTLPSPTERRPHNFDRPQ